MFFYVQIVTSGTEAKMYGPYSDKETQERNLNELKNDRSVYREEYDSIFSIDIGSDGSPEIY